MGWPNLLAGSRRNRSNLIDSHQRTPMNTLVVMNKNVELYVSSHSFHRNTHLYLVFAPKNHLSDNVSYLHNQGSDKYSKIA